jgi:hypothetical protein
VRGLGWGGRGESRIAFVVALAEVALGPVKTMEMVETIGLEA